MSKIPTVKITKIKKLNIKRFRGLLDLELDIADRVTLICGKNGTSKSTILEIIAQVFSFERDYVKNTDLKYETLDGKPFKSVFNDHFRLSSKHDPAGSADLSFTVYDSYQGKNITANLQLTGHVDRKHRFVVRQQDEQGKITNSRNFTHPVIYLSLRRLMPVSQRDKYNKVDYEYFKDEEKKQLFYNLTSRILFNIGKQKLQLTSTTGTVNATVSHGDNYDENSVSVGEDNVGQIVSALMSFKKLSEELGDEYHGGILLIDEADAGLFPAAQEKILEVFNEWSTNYNLQIIFTSHSPILINGVLNLQRKSTEQQADNRHIVHYLTDSFGPITVKKNRSWEWIENDLLARSDKGVTQDPKVAVFFEDTQAQYLFTSLMFRSKYKKFLNMNKSVKLGCKEYIAISKLTQSIEKEIIIVLDGDTEGKIPKDSKTILKLPTTLAPDQLLFLILFNISADDDYWKNTKQITRPIFLNAAERICHDILKGDYPTELTEERLKGKIIEYQKREHATKARGLFKQFSTNEDIVYLLKKRDPFKYHFDKHTDKKAAFQSIKRQPSKVPSTMR